jgi:hypothetical protein
MDEPQSCVSLLLLKASVLSSHSPAGWDPAMLQRCQLYERFISSVDGLQASPLYRQHIT